MRSSHVIRLESPVKLARVSLSLACVLALFLASAAGVQGETKPAADEKTPEAVAARAMVALKENRIADFARAMHPDALKQLKSTLLAVLDAAEKKERVDEVVRLFKGAESAADIRKLDDVAFLAAFFEGGMERQPRIRNAVRDMTFDVIGHVSEGADVIHVVYRGTVTQGGIKISKMSVMSLKPHGDDWGMLLSGDIESMATILKLQFGVED